MITKQIIFFIVCFEVVKLQNSHLKDILKMENNFFHKINSNIHTISNKIFKTLKLDKKIAEVHNFQLLLNMHYGLNKMAEKNYDFYVNMKKISENMNDNKTNGNKVGEIFLDIVREELFKLNHFKNNIKTEKETNNNHYESVNTEDSIEDKEFWKTINKLSARNILLDPILNRTYPIENAKSNRYDKKEIEALGQHGFEDHQTIKDELFQFNNNTRRIYKGKKSKIRNYPFLASIHITDKFICAGCIISKDLVLSAASCLRAASDNNDGIYRESTESPSFFVRVGSHYTNRYGDLIPVSEIIYHHSYNPDTLRNNLVFVRIKTKLKFSKNRIQRIMYDNNDYPVSESFKKVSILGWGAMDANHKTDYTLKVSMAHVDIYDTEKCKEIYSKTYVTEQNFCAGFVHKGGGACIQPQKKPTMRQTISQLRKEPRVVIAPIYASTTPAPLAPATRLPVLKRFPEEMKIVKTIIQELVLGNSTVIDYLLHGVINDTDERKTNEQNNVTKYNEINTPDNRLKSRHNVMPQNINYYLESTTSRNTDNTNQNIQSRENSNIFEKHDTDGSSSEDQFIHFDTTPKESLDQRTLGREVTVFNVKDHRFGVAVKKPDANRLKLAINKMKVNKRKILQRSKTYVSSERIESNEISLDNFNNTKTSNSDENLSETMADDDSVYENNAKTYFRPRVTYTKSDEILDFSDENEQLLK